MMNLCMDIGNTAVKVAVFDSDQLVYKDAWPEWSEEKQDQLLRDRAIDAFIVCDGKAVFKKTPACADLHVCLLLDHTTAIPLVNRYESVNTLGMDRLAAAVGAYALFPDLALLVIDLGTAVTYDYVSSEAHYLGGNISPGLSMRFRALRVFTEKLPLVTTPPDYQQDSIDFGKDTEHAILYGVMQGMYAEINTYITSFLQEKSGNVLLTGGDANRFDMSLKNRIFVEPNLLFIGLNRILILNA